MNDKQMMIYAGVGLIFLGLFMTNPWLAVAAGGLWLVDYAENR